jgi:hypothetical protein
MILIGALVLEEVDLRLLLEYFSTEGLEYCGFAAEVLGELLEQEHRREWFLQGRHASEPIMTILKKAITSGDEAARQSAIDVINQFGERGDDGYRELLDIP